MLDFTNILRHFESFDESEMVSTAMSYADELAVKLNQNQLQSGTDSDGNILSTYKAENTNVYANYTISIKKAKGQPTNKVTLKDTGEFYDSMELESDSQLLAKETAGEYRIIANFEKDGENIGDNLNVSNVLGLTEQNKDTVTEFIRPKIYEYCQAFINNIPKP